MNEPVFLEERDLVQPSIPEMGTFKIQLTASGARKALIAQARKTGLSIMLDPGVFKEQIEQASKALLDEQSQ